MPGKDRKGPQRMGPGTGRKQGLCGQNKEELQSSERGEELQSLERGGGQGNGFGRKHCRRRGFGHGMGFGRGMGSRRGGGAFRPMGAGRGLGAGRPMGNGRSMGAGSGPDHERAGE